MKSLKFGAAVVLAAVAGGALFGRIAVSQPTAAAAKVAYLDVAEFFRKYEKARKVKLEVDRDIIAVDRDLRTRAEEIMRAREELQDVYNENTVEFREKKKELDFKEFALKYEQRDRKQAILTSAVTKMNLVYTEIRNEAESYAKRNGWNAVIMLNAGDMEAQTLEQLQLMIASRPVLYRDPSLDITEQVLEILNK